MKKQSILFLLIVLFPVSMLTQGCFIGPAGPNNHPGGTPVESSNPPPANNPVRNPPANNPPATDPPETDPPETDPPARPKLGSAQISWYFDSDETCPEDVEDVVVSVTTHQGTKVFEDKVVACEDGAITIKALQAGQYNIQLQGIDTDDNVTWESNTQNLNIVADHEADVKIDLQETE